MPEHKTVAIVKLNRGAGEAYRDELIAKFRAEGTLDTYSDEMVRTNDTTYLVKIVKVDPYLLDPILGFEGRCDVTDLKRFLDKQMEQLKPYLPTEVSTTPDPEKETGTVATPPAAQIGVDPAQPGADKTVGGELPTFTGKKVENEPSSPSPEGQESENLAPSSDDTGKTEGNIVPGAETKE